MSSEIISSRPEIKKPLMRAVDVFPTEHNGQQVFCLHDPQNIAQNTLLIPPVMFYILGLFDGRHSIDDIIIMVKRQFGEDIPRENIESIINQLDRELYLESTTLKQEIKRITEVFNQSPIRFAAFAGRAYESEPEKIRQQLNQFLRMMKDENSSKLLQVNENEHPKAIISPHIDLHRGGPCFAYAYHTIQQNEPADLYVILGTGHQIKKSMFVCTKKSYETPLGRLETDQTFVDHFAQQASEDVFQEELLHRDEHSVEFQILWLTHILGDQWKGKVVPILCGSFHSYIHRGVSPSTDENLLHDLNLLKALIENFEGKVCVIAGVDLSHVGKKFGSQLGIPPSELERVEFEDLDIIEAIETGNAENFFWSIEKVKDRNNVCGLSPIYMMLYLTTPNKGVTLKYDRALETDTESVVTYISMNFY